MKFFKERYLITPVIFAFEYARIKEQIKPTLPPGAIIKLDLDLAKEKMASLPKAALALSLDDFGARYLRPLVASDIGANQS